VAGFQCKRYVDGQRFREVVEIMISFLVQLKCIDTFCYLKDLIGAGQRAEEASRAGVYVVSGRSSGSWLQC